MACPLKRFRAVPPERVHLGFDQLRRVNPVYELVISRTTQGACRQSDPLHGQVMRRPVPPVLVFGERLLAVDDVYWEVGASQEEAQQVPCLVRAEVAGFGRRKL